METLTRRGRPCFVVAGNVLTPAPLLQTSDKVYF